MDQPVASNLTRRMLLRCVGAGAVTGLTTSCANSVNQPGTSTSTVTESVVKGADEEWVNAPTAATHIHRLEEMDTDALTALPRDKTVVIIPGAYRGEHGPYLPNVDTFRHQRLARELANAIVLRPGWHAVMFPFIPLGQGGANEIGGKPFFSGTFVVRTATLRAIFMDLAAHLGEQRFRWVFVVHHHGSPLHVQALNQAGDFFHDTYGGHMVNLGGIAGLDVYSEIFEQSMTAAERAEEGWSIHAGMRETSEALYLRPDLVDPAYVQARARSVRSIEDLLEVSSQPDWPGYFGSPRLARAELGERALKEYSARTNALVMEILDGRDYRTMPRGGTAAEIKDDPGAQNALKHERAMEQQQTDWLRRHE